MVVESGSSLATIAANGPFSFLLLGLTFSIAADVSPVYCLAPGSRHFHFCLTITALTVQGQWFVSTVNLQQLCSISRGL